MKETLSNVLCVALAVVLVVGAILLGAVRGWSGEREAALHSVSEGGELSELLENRAMDAANLYVVAARHLPATDETLAALARCRDTLMDERADGQSLALADAALTDAALALAEKLPALDSVRQSARDQAYISTLTRTLSEATNLRRSYAAIVEDFNTRLNRSLTGKLAMLLGVKPLAAQ